MACAVLCECRIASIEGGRMVEREGIARAGVVGVVGTKGLQCRKDAVD